MQYRWLPGSRDSRELKAHEVNLQVYGEPAIDASFLESVKEHGILADIYVLPDNTVLSGHRRLAHAIACGLQRVPVQAHDGDMSANEQAIFIVESNRGREKTNEQKAREFKVLAEAKKALAEQARQAKGERSLNKRPGQKRTPRSVEIAAKELGMGHETAKKAAEVVDEIDQLVFDGEKQKAAKLRETLNQGSVAEAHRIVRPPQKQTTFDDAVIDGHIGKLARSIDVRANAMSLVGTPSHNRMHDCLNVLVACWSKWQKETRK